MKADTEVQKRIIGIEDGKAKIFTWDKLMGVPEKVDWMVEGLLSCGTIITVTGEPGSKKTWSFLDFAVAVASGEKEWLDFKICQHVPVLIVDEESGNQRLGMRLREVAKGHNVSNRKLPIIATCISGFNFRDEDDLLELYTIVKQSGARLILIDTLMDVLAGGDDNASKDVSPLYKGLRKIADDFKAVIIVIHHTNRNGSYRGSSAIKGSSDLMIQVKSQQDSPNIDFEITKKRDDIIKTKWAAFIFSSEGKFSLRKSGKQPSKVGKVQEFVLKYMYDYERVTIDDLAKNNGGHSNSSFKGALYKLIDDQYADRDGYDGKKACYKITQFGRDYVDTFIPSEISLAFASFTPNKKKK